MTRRAMIPVALQKARTRELDNIRTRRPLTTEERAEADHLAQVAYCRAYNALRRERWGAQGRPARPRECRL